jgi:hypothetical protein
VQRAGLEDDFRVVALRQALECLKGEQPDRARQVLMSFSDRSELPIEKATTQGACGAVRVAV